MFWEVWVCVCGGGEEGGYIRAFQKMFYQMLWVIYELLKASGHFAT